MKIVKEWAFPDADEYMTTELAVGGTYQLGHLEAALKLVSNFSLAIDGGAHIGTWSAVMSRSFDQVIAVEASPDTFECLEWNLARLNATNVQARNVALGASPGIVDMTLDEANAERKNTGARFAQEGSGTIPRETIDSWELPSLGFLKLDIEGSELQALHGAKATLRRCGPIVLFEDKGLWKRHYGEKRDAVQVYLAKCGYKHVRREGCDEIWRPA